MSVYLGKAKFCSISRVVLLGLPLFFLGFALIRQRFGQTVDFAGTTYYVDSGSTYEGNSTYYFPYACLLHIIVFLGGQRQRFLVPFIVSSLDSDRRKPVLFLPVGLAIPRFFAGPRW